MKIFFAFFVGISSASFATAAPAHYSVVHGWPMLPENAMLDEVSAVGVDSHDNVFVLTRGGRTWPDSDVLDTSAITVPTVFLFDGRTGRSLAKLGENVFALPHSLTVDSDDNVWVADVALDQIFKFSHDGKLLLTVGERAVAGDDTSHFDRPTDVAVLPDGSFYVSDGYRNARVMKFAPDGRFLLQWGTAGKGPGQFDLPHGISLDSAGRVYVVDRENARVQVFDEKGNYLSQWKGPPFVSPQSIRIGRDGTTFVAESGSDKLPDVSGFLVMHPDGSLIERVGRYGNYDGQFQSIHGIAVSKSGAVYTADFTGKRVQKFTPAKDTGSVNRPTKRTSSTDKAYPSASLAAQPLRSTARSLSPRERATTFPAGSIDSLLPKLTGQPCPVTIDVAPRGAGSVVIAP